MHDTYIYIYIKWTVFVNVTTKSAQHAHARMIAIIVEKSLNSSHMYDHGFMDNTNRQAVCKSQKNSFEWFTNSRRITLKTIKTTNVAKRFLQLIDKHFPKGHALHKLFNRNTVKVSYSCMNNMASIISGHNAKFSIVILKWITEVKNAIVANVMNALSMVPVLQKA